VQDSPSDRPALILQDLPARARSDIRAPGTLTAVLWAAAERWGHQLFSFAVFAVLARLLEPTAFGLVALASLCLSFFTILIDQGVGTAIVRLRHVESKHLSSSFWMALATSLVLLAATVLIAPHLSRWVGAEELTPVLQVLALSLPIAALTTVPVAILTRQLAFATLTRRAVLGVVVGGIAGVAAAGLGWGVWSLVFQQSTTAVIGAFILGTAVSWRPTVEISVRHLEDVGAIAAAVVFNAVAWFVCQRADQTVVGTGIGPGELAVYAVALKLITLVIELVCAPVTRVALPMLSQRQDDRSAFEASYVRLTTGSVLFGVPGLIGLALVAPEGVAIVLGEHWPRSGDLIVMVVLGGLGTSLGPLIGAATFLLLEEGLSRLTEYPNLILGPVLLLVAIYLHGGIEGLLAGRRDG